MAALAHAAGLRHKKSHHHLLIFGPTVNKLRLDDSVEETARLKNEVVTKARALLYADALNKVTVHCDSAARNVKLLADVTVAFEEFGKTLTTGYTDIIDRVEFVNDLKLANVETAYDYGFVPMTRWTALPTFPSWSVKTVKFANDEVPIPKECDTRSTCPCKLFAVEANPKEEDEGYLWTPHLTTEQFHNEISLWLKSGGCKFAAICLEACQGSNAHISSSSAKAPAYFSTQIGQR